MSQLCEPFIHGGEMISITANDFRWAWNGFLFEEDGFKRALRARHRGSGHFSNKATEKSKLFLT